MSKAMTPEEYAKNKALIDRDELLFGQSFVDQDGKRIDPVTVSIVNGKIKIIS